MCRVIVFAGTTEGRKLSAFLEERQIPAMICVATEYGESVWKNMHSWKYTAGDWIRKI